VSVVVGVEGGWGVVKRTVRRLGEKKKSGSGSVGKRKKKMSIGSRDERAYRKVRRQRAIESTYCVVCLMDVLPSAALREGYCARV